MKGAAAMDKGVRRRAAVVLGALVLAAGAAGITGCGEKHGTRAAREPVPPVSGVDTEIVQEAMLERRVEAVGTVRARVIAQVAPQVMGRVTRVLVSEGSRVAGGAPLAEIDDADLAAQAAAAEGGLAEAQAARAEADAAVAQAEAHRALAEKTFARYKALFEERVVTRQEFDEVEMRRAVAERDYERALERRRQVEARIAQAKGRAGSAHAALSHTRVAAPFDGVVTARKIDPGSLAVPGVPIFTVEDTRRYRIEGAVAEEHLGALAPGKRVEVVLDAMPGKVFAGTVSEIVPEIDPGSRTFTVKADVAAPGLRTGMSGRIRFGTGKARVVSVPRGAIYRGAGYEAVFVVAADNVARLTMVRTGQESGGRVEVLSGVAPGARVAVGALDRLSDGVRVESRR